MSKRFHQGPTEHLLTDPESAGAVDDRAVATTSLEIDHEVDQVWNALLDPEHPRHWLGPETSINPVAGGSIRTGDIATGSPKRGTVSEIDHDRHRLSFHWWPADEPEQVSQVSVVLEATPRGTLVTVTERQSLGVQACVRSLTGARPTEPTSLKAAAVPTVGVMQWRLALLAVSVSLLSLAVVR